MKNPEVVKKHIQARAGQKKPELTLRNIKNNPMKNPESLEKMRSKILGSKNIKSSIKKIGKPLKHLEPYQFKKKIAKEVNNEQLQ